MKRNILVIVICYTAFLLGIEHGGLQYALLKMAGEFGISQAAMGSIISVQFIAVTSAPLVVGIISDKVGKKKILILFSVIFIISALLCCFAGSVGIIMAAVFGIGFSFGAVETAGTAALIDAYPDKSGKYVALLQGSISVGAVVSPLILDYAMNQQGASWRMLFVMIAAGYAVAVLALLRTRFQQNDIEISEGGQQKIHVKDTLFIAGLLGCFIYMFMENGFVFFTDSFLSNTIGIPELSAVTISGFWVCMAVCRLSISMLHKYKRQIIVISFSTAGILLLMLSQVKEPAPAMVLVMIMGLFYGPIWAFSLSLVAERYPGRSGLVSSIMMTAGGIGGTLSPTVMGLIADFTGVSAGFAVLGTMSLTGAGIFIIILYKYLKG